MESSFEKAQKLVEEKQVEENSSLEKAQKLIEEKQQEEKRIADSASRATKETLDEVIAHEKIQKNVFQDSAGDARREIEESKEILGDTLPERKRIQSVGKKTQEYLHNDVKGGKELLKDKTKVNEIFGDDIKKLKEINETVKGARESISKFTKELEAIKKDNYKDADGFLQKLYKTKTWESLRNRVGVAEAGRHDFNERTDIAERVEKEFPERMGDSIVMDFKATSGARIKDPTLEVLEEKTRGELDIYRAEEHEMWKACRAMKKGFFESKEKFKEREKEAEQEIQEHKQNELKLFFYKEDKTGISDLSNAYSGIRNHVDKMLTWTLGGGHYNEQWENFFKEKERTLGGIIDFCKQYAQEKFEKTKLTPEEEKLLELEKTVKERRHWAS